MWIDPGVRYSFGCSSLLSVHNPPTDDLRTRAAAARQAGRALCDSCRALHVNSRGVASEKTRLKDEAVRLRELQASVRCYVEAWRSAAERPEAMLVDLKSVLNDGMAALPDDLKRSLSDQVISWSIGAYYGAPTDPFGVEVKR